MGIADTSKVDLTAYAHDEELYAFLEEYEATGGKMYQNRDTDQDQVKNHDQSDARPIRPRYYGRKPSNSLSSVRAQQHITQTELATRSGTTKRTIIAIEQRRRQPSVYLALALAQALDVQVESIFHLPHITPIPPSRH